MVSQTKKPLKRIIQTLGDSDDEKVDENIEKSITENQEETSPEVLATQEQSQLQSTCEYLLFYYLNNINAINRIMLFFIRG